MRAAAPVLLALLLGALSILEAPRASPRSEASPPPSSAAALKRSWNAIELGASQDRVGAILGKPERVLRIDGSVVWYYVYDVGRGSVFFDGGGKVSGLQPPVPGWSW